MCFGCLLFFSTLKSSSVEDKAIYQLATEENMGSYQAHMAYNKEPGAVPNSQESTRYGSVHL